MTIHACGWCGVQTGIDPNGCDMETTGICHDCLEWQCNYEGMPDLFLEYLKREELQ